MRSANSSIKETQKGPDINSPYFKENFNPYLLRLARETLGLSQRDLAFKIGKSAGFIAQIETGLKPADSILDELVNILGFNRSYFFQAKPVFPTGLIYYRKRSRLPKKVTLQDDAFLNHIRHTTGAILEYIQIPEWKNLTWNCDTDGSPSEAAQWVREALQIGKGPLLGLIRKLEESGIIVVTYPMVSAKLDGVSFFYEGHPFIVVNSEMEPCRMRLTIAHELGHIVMHHHYSPKPGEELEHEAFEFGSEFLVPLEEFKLGTYNSFYKLGQMKLRWMISIQALLMKAKKAQLIDQDTYQQIIRYMSSAGYRRREPREFDVPREHGTLIDECIKSMKADLEFNDEELDSVILIPAALFSRFYLNHLPKPRKNSDLIPLRGDKVSDEITAFKVSKNKDSRLYKI